jgi:hypothetical protein
MVKFVEYRSMSIMVNFTRRRNFSQSLRPDLDTERLEAELDNLPPIHGELPVSYAPSRVRAPSLSMQNDMTTPDHLEHSKRATEIGKLSAEAIASEYEAAAKDIEAMGAELLERVRQCEAMTRDALAVTEEMKDTASRYREEAKRLFLQIESCSLITADVRKTCTELKQRIAAPMAERQDQSVVRERASGSLTEESTVPVEDAARGAD